MARLTLLGAAGLAMLLAASARAGDSPSVGPYEDVLEVLAVHAWHLDDDLYRRAAATDAAGRSVHLATVERLDGWRKRFPTRLADVVDYARAQALERLGAWDDATATYERVAGVPGSPLREPAAAALERTRRFAAADALPEEGATLQDVIDALDAKLEAWREAATGEIDETHRRLALVEIERLEVRAATLLVRHRHALRDGEATAERALRALIERHPESKLLPRHVLRLADFYADEAEDYADQADRPLDFDAKTFDRLVDRALDAYQKLASWDGIPEKPIASARFDAMTSLRDATREARE
ncbi:MAG TPA: hypothetical protein VFZ11_06985 [Gemmatimonadaceae bacterium]